MPVPAYMKRGRPVSRSEQKKPHRNRFKKNRKYRMKFVWKDGVGGGVPNHNVFNHVKVELMKVTIATGAQTLIEGSGHTGLTWTERRVGDATRWVAEFTYTIQEKRTVSDDTERLILRATGTDGTNPVWRNEGAGWAWLRATFAS